jgi:hypothetical protein
MAGDGDIQCGLCRRNLLTGERSHGYLDVKSGQQVMVCSLCVERAEKSGWQLLDEAPMQVAAIADDSDRTVRLLTAQVNALQSQLDNAVETIEETRDHSSSHETEIDTLAARLTDAETEGAAVRAALAEVERRLEQTQHALEESQAAQQTVMRARRREADEVYLVGIAGEVFNRAPQAATIGLLVGLHGTPAVRITSSRSRVATTLPYQYFSGTSTDSPTSDLAAKCSTPSKDPPGSRSRARATMSPSTNSAPAGIASALPVDRSSTMTT